MAERIELSDMRLSLLEAVADGECSTFRTQEFRAFRALKALGFVTEHEGRMFRITPAGRLWLKEHGHG